MSYTLYNNMFIVNIQCQSAALSWKDMKLKQKIPQSKLKWGYKKRN